jgi:ABC-type branched-subunit amino acid transport system ATPase component
MQLATDSITKTFAGLHALSDVSLAAEEGEIVGIIGPNGSGKTTLVNVISGVIPPTSGTVRLGSDSWTRRPSHRIARCGIARTFQTIRLFEEMTVLENVEVAATCSREIRGRRQARAATRDALRALSLEDRADAVASTLSYGLQRRVELARAAVGRPHFLLLDEPAAGLNDAESDDLLATLLRLRDAIGCGVLLIDHDLRLIMRGTDRIHVLNEGRTLAEGTPDAIRRDPRVIAAYLGTDANARAVPTEEGDMTG